MMLLLLLRRRLVAAITGIGGGAAGVFLVRLAATRRGNVATWSDGVGSIPGALERGGKRVQILAQRSLEGGVGSANRNLNIPGALGYVQIDGGDFGLRDSNGDVVDRGRVRRHGRDVLRLGNLLRLCPAGEERIGPGYIWRIRSGGRRHGDFDGMDRTTGQL